MDNQYKQKKQVSKLSDDNKLYIEFLKHCEIEQTNTTCFSPASLALRQHGSSTCSQKNQNCFMESNQNILGQKVTVQNIQSAVALKIQNQFTVNTPQNTSPPIVTLFDFMLKKHDQLYKEIAKQDNSNIATTADRKSMLLTQTKIEEKKLKLNINSLNNVNDYGQDTRRNTVQAGSNFYSNTFNDENGANSANILQKEETLRIIYKNPANLHVQKFKIKIVPLLMQEPLLAISIQDITQNEEEKKVKKIEQDNNTINLQVISKIKSHLEYLYKNISKIKNQKMRQSIIFPLQIIRSTGQIEKNRINFEPFPLSTLLKEIATTFSNVIQVKVKQTCDPSQNYFHKLTQNSQKIDEGGLLQLMNECQSEDNDDQQKYLKDFYILDPLSIEEQELHESVKQQKESIIDKYNLAGIISAHHEILSFQTQKQLPSSNLINTNIQGSDVLGQIHTKGLKQVNSEFTIPNNVQSQPQHIQQRFNSQPLRDQKFYSCEDINQEKRKSNLLRYGNKIPIRSKIENDNVQYKEQQISNKSNNNNSNNNQYQQDNNQKVLSQITPDNSNTARTNWMVKSISNDHLISQNALNDNNSMQSKRRVDKNAYSYHNNFIIYNQIIPPPSKQKLVSQINNKLKQLDQTVSLLKNAQNPDDRHHRQTVTEEMHKRGLSIPSTSITYPSSYQNQTSVTFQNYPSVLQQNQASPINQNQASLINQNQPSSTNQNQPTQTNQNQKQTTTTQSRPINYEIECNNENDCQELISPPKKHSLHQNPSSQSQRQIQVNINSALTQNQKYTIRDERSSFQSSNYTPRQTIDLVNQINQMHQINQEAQTNQQKKQTLQLNASQQILNHTSQLTWSKQEQNGNGAAAATTSLMNSQQNLGLYTSTQRKISVHGSIQPNLNENTSFMTNHQNMKSSTQLETDANEIASEKEIRLNNILNHQAKPEIKLFNNFRLIFQALSSIITCFGQQKVQIIIEPLSKKLYNSIRFTIQPAININQSPGVLTPQTVQTTATPIFNFENSPQLSYQHSMLPNLNTPNQSIRYNSNQHPIDTLNSPNKAANNAAGKQFSCLKVTTKFDIQPIKKTLLTEDDFKRNLYDLNQLNNKQLSNKIWKSIKEIAQSIGPENIQCTENSISIEFFTNMNIIKDAKFLNQDINLNISNMNSKPSRNSLFSQQFNLQNLQNSNHLTANFNSISLKDPTNSIINNHINNSLNNNNSNNISTNLIQNQLRFEPLSATNKNSYNNLYLQNNNNNSFLNNLSNTYIMNDLNSGITNGKISKHGSKRNLTSISISQQQFPSYQQSVNEPFMINSKYRIPEEEEQPYKKKQNSIASLSLISIQSQQDEGVREVQPIKNFLNQNSKFSCV